MLLAASQGIPRAIAAVIGIVLTIAFVVYIGFNFRKARPEIGSEIELAPNRKPYYSDEELEGKRLETGQLLGFAMLVVCALAIPLYWLHEPGRQTTAAEKFDKRFASWGSQLFAPTASGGFNCAGCHGGMGGGGGAAQTVVTDPNTGEVKQVNWAAPALNTVLLRYSEEEVRTILVYGRKFSPMSAWGVEGGGPMNEQQITTLISYLKSIQLCDPALNGTCEKAQADVQTSIDEAKAAAEKAGTTFDLGAFLFSNLKNSGAYSCARCHTSGWSYGDPKVTGGGALGPNLTAGSTVRQFPSETDMINFIKNGSVFGEKYGMQGQGSGRMPGFGKMLTDEQVTALVEYVRSLR
ncbi:MAG: cytochrome c [Acidimicrobiia bacterium]